jgi:hypothetical protein
VLVVEDERDIRELLRRYLERADYSVLTAATGAQALALLGNTATAVRISVPSMSGRPRSSRTRLTAYLASERIPTGVPTSGRSPVQGSVWPSSACSLRRTAERWTSPRRSTMGRPWWSDFHGPGEREA